MNLPIRVAFAAMLLCPSFAAWAEPSDATGVRTLISYSDLDLTSEVGVDALHARVEAAARAGCGRLYRGDALAFPVQVACRRSAVANARPQIARAIGQAHARQLTDDTVLLVAR